MQVLYRDEEGALAVLEVTKASYIEEAGVLEVCGSEEDIALAMDEAAAQKAVRELYADGKADLSAYEYQEMDLDDDFDDDDDDDDEDDFLDRLMDMDFGTVAKDSLVFGEDE